VSPNRRKPAEVDIRQSGGDARRDEDRLRRRNALLEAAIDAIHAIGPGATMEQLAKAGGVTKPILYRHFGDRDGLIGELAQRWSAELLTSVVTPLLAEADPRGMLDSTVEGYVAFVERDPHLYGFLMQQASPRDGHRTPISSLVDVVAKQIAVVMGEELRSVGRDTGAAVPWAYGIVGLVNTATDWWLQERTMSRERFVAYLTDLLWNGIVTAGAVDASAAATPAASTVEA